MRVKMQYKTANLADWKTNLRFNITKNSDAIVEKTITVNKEDFDSLCGNFLEDQEFIVDNLQHMYYEDGVFHCIAVTSESSGIAVLIDSEGYKYARYAAIVPKDDCI